MECHVDARVRLAIVECPGDAPRGAVTTFCAEHKISPQTFDAIRVRVRADGAAAALEPRSRRRATSPTRIGDEVKEQAIDVRAALESPMSPSRFVTDVLRHHTHADGDGPRNPLQK